jgi:hypothetical protein
VRLHYNLSYLHRRQFRLQEADQAYRRAREVDAGIDRFLTSICWPSTAGKPRDPGGVV